MGHFVQAFIGSRPLLERIQKQYAASQVVDLDQGLALLPMLDTLYDAIPDGENTELLDKHFQFLTPKIVALLVQNSEHDSIGYFETEYFGGSGDQGAILAYNGKVIFGPQVGAGSINMVLKQMGVEEGIAHDEFEAIGLGRFRSNEDWIEKPDFLKDQDLYRPIKCSSKNKSIAQRVKRWLKLIGLG